MGVVLPLAVIVGLVGLGTLFVAPWLGGALLLAAVICAVIGVVWMGAKSEELAQRDEPETPHMRGPAS